MVYNTTVTECLNGVTIYGDIGLDNEKINILKQLCNKNTLLVLDNFDVSLEKGNEVNSLLELQSKVIITTRTDFSDIYPYSRFLTLYGLPVVELKKVFENESGLSLSADDENELSSIYHLGESCTYFWTLVARLTGTGAYSISEIVNKILSGLDDLDESEKVLDTKDGLHIKRTVAKAMSNLFKLEGFEQEEYETLESLYYLDRLNLSKRQIKDVFALCNSVSGHKLMNVFNNLLEKGYIERYQYRKNDAYRINDVLKNVIEYELNPVLCRSKVLTPFIENKLFAHKTWLSSIEYDDTAEQDNASYRFKCLFSILQRINWTNQNDAEYSVNLIYDMIGGEAHAAGYAYNDYSSEVFRSIIKYAMDQNANPIIRLKAFVIICSWSCHWIQTTLFEAFDDIKRRHIKDAEMYFGNAIEIIDNNKISDETLMNDLCRPFVGAFMRSNSTAKYEMFSGCLIEKILSMDPVCIRNAEVIPWKSFKIRCLLNKEYEAIYLKDAIKKLTSMDADDAEQFAYITIGRILLNGGMVSVIVSEQLRQLRIEVFKYCIARFFDCENGNSLRLDDIDPSDFAPYSLGLPKSMTIGEGIERFMYSLLENISEMVYEAKRQKSIEEEKFDLMTNEHNMWGSDFPILFNEKGEYDIGLFINAISPEMSSDNLNYIVQEYWGIVDQMLTPLSLEERLLATIFDCDDDEEKDKYIGVADLLQECLESMVNKDRFEPTYDRWSMSQIVKDSYCIETEIESIKAVIYAKRYDRRNLDVCMKKVLCHSDEYLFSLNDDDIIDYEHGMDCDVCFWYAFNRIRRLSGYGDFLLSLLIDYSHVVENHFNVGNEPDARMYNYYKEIVEVANCALKEESAWNSLIKTDDSDLCDDKTNHIREIIDTYSVLLERLSGQEYHP